MYKVLLSIKPKFAYKIFDGSQKYEFSKSIFKKDVSRTIISVAYSLKEVVGEFQIEEILNNNVDKIRQKTALYLRITKEFYQRYFENKKNAYAIKVGKTIRYEHSKKLSDYNVEVAPQSFMYI